MKPFVKITCFVITVILCLAGLCLYASPDHVIIINPGDASCPEMMYPVKAEVIYEWGRSMGLYLMEDEGPVSDGIAGYIPDGELLEFSVDGTVAGRFYSIIPDAVRFRNPGDVNIPSLLKMYVRGGRYPWIHVGTWAFTELDRAPVIPLPAEITASGKIFVRFEECSQTAPALQTKGMWGFWDIIITDTGNSDSGKQSIRP